MSDLDGSDDTPKRDWLGVLVLENYDASQTSTQPAEPVRMHHPERPFMADYDEDVRLGQRAGSRGGPHRSRVNAHVPPSIDSEKVTKLGETLLREVDRFRT